MLQKMYDPLRVKLHTRLRLQFSHVYEHKFKYGFGYTTNPICASRVEVETTDRSSPPEVF